MYQLPYPGSLLGQGCGEGRIYIAEDSPVRPVRTGSGKTSTRQIYSLAIDPTVPSTLYAGTPGNIYKTTNGGSSWQSAATGLPASIVMSIMVDPRSGAVYAGLGNPSGIADGVFKSTDGGASWTAVNTGLPKTAGGYYLVWELDLDSSGNPSTLYAATEIGGIFKSTNEGASWTAANANLDGSSSFSEAYGVKVDRVIRTNIYAGTENAILKSTDGGASWTTLSSGISGTFFAALAVDPLSSANVLAGNNSDVFRSSDGGASFAAASSGLHATRVDTVLFYPATNTLFAGDVRRVDGCVAVRVTLWQ